MVVFGFEFQKNKVNIVLTLFYKLKDLLQLAKIELGKILNFQILPFIFNFIGIVIIFISLKYFQAKENAMINYIINRKPIGIMKKNKYKDI